MMWSFHYLEQTVGRRSDALKREENLSRVMKASGTEFSKIFFAKSPLKLSPARGLEPTCHAGDGKKGDFKDWTRIASNL